MDWAAVIDSEPTEEEEGGMSNLVAGFTARMRKQVASSLGETTSGFGGKRPKLNSPDEEAPKSLAIIIVDSPERASDVQQL